MSLFLIYDHQTIGKVVPYVTTYVQLSIHSSSLFICYSRLSFFTVILLPTSVNFLARVVAVKIVSCLYICTFLLIMDNGLNLYKQKEVFVFPLKVYSDSSPIRLVKTGQLVLTHHELLIK